MSNLKKTIILFFTIFVLPTNLLADAEISLLYGAANPDYKPFNSPYGYAINAQYNFDNGLFISGYFNETDFTASGPFVGREEVKSWSEVGIGYSFDHEWGQFYSLISYESIDAETQSYNGFGAHFGYRNQFSTDLTGLIQFGYIDTDFNDVQLIGKLFYSLTDSLSLTLGIRDYNNWDYTYYDTGIVYKF